MLALILPDSSHNASCPLVLSVAFAFFCRILTSSPPWVPVLSLSLARVRWSVVFVVCLSFVCVGVAGEIGAWREIFFSCCFLTVNGVSTMLCVSAKPSCALARALSATPHNCLLAWPAVRFCAAPENSPLPTSPFAARSNSDCVVTPSPCAE